MKKQLGTLIILAACTWNGIAAESSDSADDVRSTVKDWPEGVTEIQIPGASDGVVQPALYYNAESGTPRPLVVFLHPWGGNYWYGTGIPLVKGCIKNGWSFIQPEFRGPNTNAKALGSDLVIADVANAVAYAKEHGNVDPQRIYLVGASGGGHATLLVAGRLPGVFAAVSAWVPITDLVAWHAQTKGTKYNAYAKNIENACGGEPGPGSAAEAEARKRSPLTHLASAGKTKVDINAGIQDGHEGGAVPISHSLLAYNLLAKPEDRISDADMESIVTSQTVPENLRFTGEDRTYGKRKVIFRKSSDNVRVTVTDGRHEILVPAAIAWLQQQMSDSVPPAN